MLAAMHHPITPDTPRRGPRRARRALFLLLTAALPSLSAPARAAESAPILDFVTSRDGLPLCVLETGNPAGRELLLIHGFSQSYAVFNRQYLGPLAKDYRIVAMDLRGHGCSGKPWSREGYEDTKLWADDVAAVIAARKLRRPLVVGWSFGGYVAVDYARHHGTNGIAGIVMVGSNAGLIPLDAAARERTEATRAATRAMKPDVEKQIADGQQFVKFMTANPAPEDMATIMFATNQMLPTYARRMIAWRSLDHSDYVGRLDTPVWLVVGTKDGSQSVEALRKLAADLPRGKLVPIEGAGHAPFIDQPEAFDAELRRIVEATRAE
jgi:pimeloyl-ACP methyl ester carboxylesterase